MDETKITGEEWAWIIVLCVIFLPLGLYIGISKMMQVKRNREKLGI